MNVQAIKAHDNMSAWHYRLALEAREHGFKHIYNKRMAMSAYSKRLAMIARGTLNVFGEED